MGLRYNCWSSECQSKTDSSKPKIDALNCFSHKKTDAIKGKKNNRVYFKFSCEKIINLWCNKLSKLFLTCSCCMRVIIEIIVNEII